MRSALGVPAPAFFWTDLHQASLDALAVLRLRRRIRFRDQHVTVRQHIEPTWMLELRGECRDRRARRSDRLAPFRPAARRRDVQGGDDRFVRRRQLRLRTRARFDGQPCRVSATAPKCAHAAAPCTMREPPASEAGVFIAQI